MYGRMSEKFASFLRGYPTNVDFLLILTGRIVSNAGDSFYLIAAMWLVYDLTGSTVYTGVAGLLLQIPAGLQFLTGPLVDRWPLRGVLVISQVIQGIVVLSIPIATYLGLMNVWLALAVIPILAMLNQFMSPATNSALPRIVPDQKLVRASSLFRAAYQGTEVVFQAVGGALIVVIGAIGLYVVDSVTFLVAAAAFLSTTIPPAADDETEGSQNGPEEGESTDRANALRSYVNDLKGGIEYVRGSLIVPFIVAAAAANFGFGVAAAVLPAYADQIGGPSTYGFILAAIAAGQFVGTLLSFLTESFSFGRMNVVMFSLAGMVWMAAIVLPFSPVALLLFGFAMLPFGIYNIAIYSSIMSVVPDEFMGRVISLVTSGGTVSLAFGSLLGGIVGDAFGARQVMLLTTLSYAAVAVIYLGRPRLFELPAVPQIDAATLLLTTESKLTE